MSLVLIITSAVIAYVFIGVIVHKFCAKVLDFDEDSGAAFAGTLWPIAIPFGILCGIFFLIITGCRKAVDGICELPEHASDAIKMARIKIVESAQKRKDRTQQKKRSKGELSITKEYSGGELSKTDT